MEINWIKIAIGVIIVLIIYTFYKVVNVMKDIKEMKKTMLPAPGPSQPHQPAPHNVAPVTNKQHPQPSITPSQTPTTHHQIPIKIQPPTFKYNKLDTVKESHLHDEKEEELYDESSDFEENDYEDDINVEKCVYDQDNDNMDMIIPLDLNCILEQVINEKMTSKKPHTEIQEIVSESLTNNTDKSPSHNNHNDLKSKTIAELKELAKSMNIKLTENGKPKNKETLIKEISNI
jgi:hypothetical protein